MPLMPKVNIFIHDSNIFFNIAVEQVTQEFTTTVKDADMQAVFEMAVEIPFVPTAQRNATQIVDDSIVVVGQARQKKRKRPKATVDEADLLHSADILNTTKTKQESVNPAVKDEEPNDVKEKFDFSEVPNILDNNPDLEESTIKKKKQKNKNGVYVNQGAWYWSTSFPQANFTETFLLHQKHTVSSRAEANPIALSSRIICGSVSYFFALLLIARIIYFYLLLPAHRDIGLLTSQP